MKICHIISAMQPVLGEIRDGIVIAADAGYKYAKEAGIEPDIVVGDFDSLGYTPEAGHIVRHPVMKDDTDTMLAVKTGLEKGCDTFFIYGGTGGRLDHTIANIQTLSYIADNGAQGFIAGETNVTVIKNLSLLFPETAQGVFSVFALFGEAHGVHIENALYPLRNHTLTPSFPLGVSNEFIPGRKAKITVKKGAAAVIWQYAVMPEVIK